MDSVWGFLGGEFYSPTFSIAHRTALRRSGLPAVARGTELNHIDSVYAQSIEELTAARVEFLIADGHYLRQMGLESRGQLTRGEFEFHTLVLPPLYLLPLDLATKIVGFASSGGAVIALGRLPAASTENGEDCPRMDELMDLLRSAPSFRSADQGIADLLERGGSTLEPQLAFESEAFELTQLHRRIDGRDFFWLVNDGEQPRDCRLRLRGVGGAASLWDCERGTIAPVPSVQSETGSVVELTFAPYQAFWLVFDPELDPVQAEPVAAREERTMILDRPWRISIDPAAQPPPAAPTPELPAALLSQGGDERALSPWLDWGLDHFTGMVDYRTSFEAPVSGGSVVLDLGTVSHTAEVFVNGQRIGARLWPPFEFEIGAAVKPGENEVLVRVGNLLCNGMRHYVETGVSAWRPRPPRPDEYDAGMLGPVTVRYRP